MAFTPLADRLPAATGPGVSLVTCCMNRNENLLRALPSWLAQPDLAEILIVDWSSAEPVAASLIAAGIEDPRIRIARVDGEPRWILSWAFNLGFRLASHGTILKVDADIVLAPGFLAANRLAPGTFIAGNWRNAAPGQEFVNGFFLAAAADLAAVHGFSEFITTYGWDDDDLYNRLTERGLQRRDVAPDTVRHLDHDDAARMGARATGQNGHDDLAAQTIWKIRTNRAITALMPPWAPKLPLVPMKVAPADQGWRLYRDGAPPAPVPRHIQRMAETAATRELVYWRVGFRALALDDAALQLLLDCRRLDMLRPLHVELLLAGAGAGAVATLRHLVVDCDGPLSSEQQTALSRVAHASGRCLVLRRRDRSRPDDPMPFAAASELPELGRDAELGEAVLLQDPAQVPAHAGAPVVRLSLPPATVAAPAISAGARDRLVIDAQHGLGNRLRALGSGAAIARATGRELVVLWQPDHHCQARFGDLFEPAAFEVVEDLPPAPGEALLNYMEIEPGSRKDAPLVLTPGRAARVRTAYVVNHPAASWAATNAELRLLRPVAAVRDLMAGVADHRDIGLHVRMEGSPGTDQNSYDSAENWTAEGHAAINHWRSASHFGRFMARLDRLLDAQPQARIFLAADLPETYRAFAETYGPRVAWLERTAFDRSALQLQYALADILLLARCRQFLGSNWSSFSELALRLSDSITHHELSGVDF